MKHYNTWERNCFECNRNFDLRNNTDCEEWYLGHDCESQPQQQQYTNKEVNK